MKPTLVEPNDPKWVVAATCAVWGTDCWYNDHSEEWVDKIEHATVYEWRPDTVVRVPFIDGVARYKNLRAEALGHVSP